MFSTALAAAITISTTRGRQIDLICLVYALQIKAALRTVVPPEHKYLEEEPKVSKQVCLCIMQDYT